VTDSKDQPISDTREQSRLETIAASRKNRRTLPIGSEFLKFDLLERRAEAASRFIDPGMRVLDVGCAAMLVEPHLPPGCTYLPLDCVARDERTFVCDLNSETLPPIQADIAVVLGVLEYLYDIPLFLQRLFQVAPKASFLLPPRSRPDPRPPQDAVGQCPQFK